MVAALVVAMIVSSFVVRRAAAVGPTTTVVRMAGSSPFLDDPRVIRELNANGIRVEGSPSLGSWDVAKLPNLASYDIAVVGSAQAGASVVANLESHRVVDPQVFSPYSEPMIILVHQKILELLERREIGIASQRDGIWMFDVKKYLDVVTTGKRWKDISGNADFSNPNRILLTTTDPANSNSGGMFLAIASYVLNNNNTVQLSDIKKSILLLRQAYAELGWKEQHTPILMDKFLAAGAGRFPMAMVYENNFVAKKLSHPEEIPSDLVLMYPNPTVIPDETLVYWTPKGRKLIDTLQGDSFRALEEALGCRTTSNNVTFVDRLAKQHIKVAQLAELPTAQLPEDDVLQQLIAQVSHGH